MKYQKTIYVDMETLEKLETGEIKIQCGQWIQLAWLNKPSRWAGLTNSGSIWALHSPCKKSKFTTMCVRIKRFQGGE
tara:strand:+ start:114 stop:344 length:231 start_codon:yes stop_codon:yes gene_type:complete